MLRQPLGDWLQDSSTRRISLFAYRDRRTLFIRSQNGYITCRLLRLHTFEDQGQVVPQENIPSRAQPVEVIMSSPSTWTITSTTNVSSRMDHQQRPVATFEDYLSTLDAWEYDLLRHSTLFADAFTINEDLRASFMAGSDGSEMYSTDGAFGLMLSNNSGERAASGMGPSCGWRMDSYRAECSGMLSLLRFLIRLGEYTFRVDSWNDEVEGGKTVILERALRAAFNTPSLVGPLTNLEIDVFVQWLGIAYRSKEKRSRLGR
jgi:hypothetical protein